MNRRQFLVRSLFGTTACVAAPRLFASRSADPGPLRAADENGLRLPAGFRSRVIAVSGEKVAGTDYVWHSAPDGGACFAVPGGGHVYVSNSEVSAEAGGGVGAVRFDRDGRIAAAYRILGGTRRNCAGGPTPWRTWLSCEEMPDGQVHECDPLTPSSAPAPLPALGIFNHEAAAVDPIRRVVYLTEDDPEGRFFRFVPSPSDWPEGAARPALKTGVLQALRYRDLAAGEKPDATRLVKGPAAVTWENIERPELPQTVARRVLVRAAGTPFAGAEGLWFHGSHVHFSTKRDNRIWRYTPGRETLDVLYDVNTAAPEDRILSGVDNITVMPDGSVLVAEDGGDMQLCALLADGRVVPIVQASDLLGPQLGSIGAGSYPSEMTGPAFSLDGAALYFSAQRNGRNGTAGDGITFEVRGPFIRG